MLKKTIKYEDYNGEPQVEDFYFNLTKAELVELEVSEKEGFAETLQAVIAAKDGNEIIATFKRIILMSYGEKSADGKRFIKNQELRDAFAQTEAYSNLFMELATDAGAAAEFIKGIVPAGMAEKMQDVELPFTPETGTDEPTEKDLAAMSKEELIEHFSNKK